MNDIISLKKVERKIFSIATQDGLTDIFLGCVFLVFAVAPFLSADLGDFWSSAVFVPFWAVIALAIWLTRRYVIKPRIGEVKFGAVRRNRLHRFHIVMLIANAIAFALGLWLSFSNVELSGSIMTIRFVLICLIISCLAAYFLDYPRLYVYGLLVGLSPLIGEWLWSHGYASHHGFPIAFGITSSVMILTGFYFFIRLLRANPILKKENILEELQDE